MTEVRSCDRDLWPAKPNICRIWPFTAKTRSVILKLEWASWNHLVDLLKCSYLGPTSDSVGLGWSPQSWISIESHPSNANVAWLGGIIFWEPRDLGLELSSSTDETNSNGTEWASAVPGVLFQVPEQMVGTGSGGPSFSRTLWLG